jgi:hypothetical protein
VNAGRLARILLTAATSSLAVARTAEPPPEPPKYDLPAPTDLTPEEQARILKAFEAADAHLRLFARNFPSARFSMVRAEPKSTTIIIATTVEFGRYGVSLVFSGAFDADFTKVPKARCDLFGAYDNERQLKPKERRRPLPLKLGDMDEFCREPEPFLARQFAQQEP